MTTQTANLVPVTDLPTVILQQYFEILPMGIEICPGTEPPQNAWDSLIKYLSFCNDSVCWQIASACNKYPKRFRTDAYALAASLFNCSEFTIQQYCYIERNVPYEARVSGLTIWQHRPVAKIDNPELQRAYLEVCQLGDGNESWSIGKFEDWLSKQGVEVEEHHMQSDRKFQQEKEAYDTITELALTKKERDDALAELKETKAKLETTPKPEAQGSPTTGPDLTDLDRTHLLQVKDTLIDNGYTSVTVWSNGDITWHK